MFTAASPVGRQRPRYLSTSNAIEDREAARQHVDQILAVSGGLPVFAHWNVRNILPKLHLELRANPPLLIEASRVEPGGAQGFDARARRPTNEGREPIGADPHVAIRVGVRD